MFYKAISACIAVVAILPVMTSSANAREIVDTDTCFSVIFEMENEADKADLEYTSYSSIMDLLKQIERSCERSEFQAASIIAGEARSQLKAARDK